MHMIKDFLHAYNTMLNQHAELVMATVVDIEGSAYHRPGARMLIGPNCERFGSISGGCLEKDLVKKAWWMVKHGARLVSYDTRVEEDDVISGPFNTGCQGVVHILLEKIKAGTLAKSSHAFVDVSKSLDFVLKTGAASVVATVYRCDTKDVDVGDRLILNKHDAIYSNISDANLAQNIEADAMRILSEQQKTLSHCYNYNGLNIDVLFEYIKPPKSLMLFGAGDDAIPMMDIAKKMGWTTYLIDKRVTLANKKRFPSADHIIHHEEQRQLWYPQINADTVFVLMTHNLNRDLSLLPELMASSSRYIGVLGPVKRMQLILKQLAKENITFSHEQLEKLRSPIGLDISANGAHEIALAVAAEIIAAQNAATAGFLKDKTGSLHKPLDYAASVVLPVKALNLCH